jgi:hypothetical protein
LVLWSALSLVLPHWPELPLRGLSFWPPSKPTLMRVK